MSEMLQLTERVRGSRRGRGFRRYRPLGFEPCEGRLLLAASGVDDVASFGMRLTTVGVAAAETQIDLKSALDKAAEASRSTSSSTATGDFGRHDDVGILQLWRSADQQSFSVLHYQPAQASFLEELDWDERTSPASSGLLGLLSASVTASDGSTSTFFYAPADDDPIMIVPRADAALSGVTSQTINLESRRPLGTTNVDHNTPWNTSLHAWQPTTSQGNRSALSTELRSSLVDSEIGPRSGAALDAGIATVAQQRHFEQGLHQSADEVLGSRIVQFPVSLVTALPLETTASATTAEPPSRLKEVIVDLVWWGFGVEEALQERTGDAEIPSPAELANGTAELEGLIAGLRKLRQDLEAAPEGQSAPRLAASDATLAGETLPTIDVGLVWDAPIETLDHAGTPESSYLDALAAKAVVQPITNAQQSMLPFELAAVAVEREAFWLSGQLRLGRATAMHVGGNARSSVALIGLPVETAAAVPGSSAGAASQRGTGETSTTDEAATPWSTVALLAALAIPLLVRVCGSSDKKTQAEQTRLD